MNAAPDDLDFPDDLDALTQVCPACGAFAEYPDCVACGFDFSAAVADPASAITYARGYGKFDAAPRLMTAANFASFRDVVLADRCTGKGQGWVMASTAVAPDDSLHRASFPKSIGKPHRCAACVQPRRWIGFDIDGGLTPESFAALVIALQPLSALTHTTASHTPTTPRCRIIVELDALADRGEMIRASAALRARLDAAMVEEGHSPPQWDAGCDRPEQMLYLPLMDSETFTMDGEPACLAELLAEAAPEAVQAPPAQAEPQAAQGNAALVQAVLSGGTLHDATRDLLFRLIDDGATQSKAVEIVRGLMLAMPDRGDPGRWQQRYADLPRMAGDAAAKLSARVETETDEQPHLVRAELGDLADVRPCPVEFVVADLIPRKLVTMLGAHGGAGKSSLALVLAAHVAAGRPWARFDCEPGHVCLVSLEDDADIARWRLGNICRVYELDPAQVAANIELWDGSSGATLVREVSTYGAKAIAAAPGWKTLAAFEQCDLLIIDNASDGFQANANDAGLVRQFVRMLGNVARRLDAAVLLLAHIDKASAKHGAQGNSYFGSTAWHNSARSRLALVKDEGRLELHHEKINFGTLVDPLPLAFADHGVIVPQGSTGAATTANCGDALLTPGDADTVLRLMRKAIDAGEPVRCARSGPCTGWHSLRHFGMPACFEGGKGKRRFWTAIDHLANGGSIQHGTFMAQRKERQCWVIAPEQQAALAQTTCANPS